MCAFCRPSPSAPRRIIFISLLVCKTTEKIVIERNSCFSVSGIQCSNAAPHPGRAQAEGENWLSSSRNNPMYVALSPHDSPSFELQSKLFLVWMLMMKSLKVSVLYYVKSHAQCMHAWVCTYLLLNVLRCLSSEF